ALLFVPFAMVSYVTAYVLWTIVNLFLLCGSAVLLWPYLANLRRLSPAVAVLLIFSSFPVFVSILQGQDSILLLAIFAASFVALKRNRAEIAGLLLALGTFKFQVVIPVMAIFLLQRRWKLATGFLVGVAGLVGMSATVVGWRTMLAYPRLLHHIEHGLVGVTPRVMPNIRGLVASLPGGSGCLALWLHFNAVYLIACPIGLLAIGLAAALLQQKAAPTARAALA